MDTNDHQDFSRALVNCLILLSAGAAAIHFAVIGEHFDEYWAYGMFFAVAAWLQLLWSITLRASVTRWLLHASVLGNTIIIGVWAISRTSGLPVGPHSGSPESLEFIDVLATVFEALIVVGGLLLLRRWTERLRVGERAATATWIVTALIVVPLTTAAIASVSVADRGSDVFHEAPHHQTPHHS